MEGLTTETRVTGDDMVGETIKSWLFLIQQGELWSASASNALKRAASMVAPQLDGAHGAELRIMAAKRVATQLGWTWTEIIPAVAFVQGWFDAKNRTPNEVESVFNAAANKR